MTSGRARTSTAGISAAAAMALHRASSVRSAVRGRSSGQSIGRPKALDEKKAALAQRMHVSGESASTIAATLNVSRATVYRVLSDQAG
jgi:DNA invertase Pin-like site-specific DNA recombinase